jgi:hypothetical protein
MQYTSSGCHVVCHFCSDLLNYVSGLDVDVERDAKDSKHLHVNSVLQLLDSCGIEKSRSPLKRFVLQPSNRSRAFIPSDLTTYFHIVTLSSGPIGPNNVGK